MTVSVNSNEWWELKSWLEGCLEQTKFNPETNMKPLNEPEISNTTVAYLPTSSDMTFSELNHALQKYGEKTVDMHVLVLFLLNKFKQDELFLEYFKAIPATEHNAVLFKRIDCFLHHYQLPLINMIGIQEIEYETLLTMLSLLSDKDREDVLRFYSEEGNNKYSFLNAIARSQMSADNFLKILALIPESKRLDALTAGGPIYSALSSLLSKELSLSKILQLIPKKALLKLSQSKESVHYSHSLLDAVLYDLDTFKMIFSLYDAEKRLLSIEEKDEYGYTLFDHALEFPNSLEALFLLLPEEKRTSIILQQNEAGVSRLFKAAGFDKSFDVLLNFLNQDEASDGLLKKDNANNSSLFWSLKSPKNAKKILSMTREDERLKRLQEPNKNGMSILHEATNYPDTLKAFLSLLPEKDRQETVLFENEEGVSVLFYSARTEGSFSILLDLIPEVQHKRELFKNNRKGETALNYAIYVPSHITRLLDMCTEAERFDLLTSLLEGRKSPLQMTVCFPESFEALLSSLPKNRRLSVLTDTYYRQNLLSSVYNDKYYLYRNIEKILNLLSEEEGVKILTDYRFQDKKTLLDFVIDRFHLIELRADRLQMVFKNFSEDSRLKILRIVYKFVEPDLFRRYVLGECQHISEICSLLFKVSISNRIIERDKLSFFNRPNILSFEMLINKSTPEEIRKNVIDHLNSEENEYNKRLLRSLLFYDLQNNPSLSSSSYHEKCQYLQNKWDEAGLLLPANENWDASLFCNYL